MTNFIGYTFLLLGIPCWVGLLSSLVVVTPLLRLLKINESAHLIISQLSEIFDGFVTLIVGIYLFKILNLNASIWILFISMAWISLYHLKFKIRVLGWLSWITGMILAWFSFN